MHASVTTWVHTRSEVSVAERMNVDDNARPTRPSDTTREFEATEARVHGEPDEMPTAEEEAAAERAGEPSAETERAYEEAIERGARQKGEGRLP